MNRRSKVEEKVWNISKIFILPMIDLNYKSLPYNFVNSYITEDYEVVLVFDKTNNYDIKFYRFLEGAKNRHVLLTNIVEEDDEIALFYKIPSIWKEDFDKFKEGKYSKFSKDFKNKIESFYGSKLRKEGHEVSEYNIIYPEFNKGYKRKQIAEWLEVDLNDIDEVFQAPNLDREIYKPIQILISTNNTNSKIGE